MILSIDAMGGDHAPEVILKGVALALDERPDLRFLLHGDMKRMRPFLAAHQKLEAACEVRHTDKEIAMDEAPALALRKSGRQSSMWRALESVQQREAQAALSAGNTAALMGMAKLVLKTLPGIDRPAIAARWPIIGEDHRMSIVLDLGATVNPSASQLVQFAVMGRAAARALLGVEEPKLGLLNIGAEDTKGTQEVRDAAQILRDDIMPDHFYGFVEGDELGKGNVDVIVTDGFSGNIALKTAEGTSRLFGRLLRKRFAHSLATKLGAWLARSVFGYLNESLNPNQYNGGVFLGLEGLVVKSHGGSDADGFAAAIRVAERVAHADLVARIAQDLPKPDLVKAS